ncbi:MAG: hypothetical protein ACYC21_10925 [Eubacteriales bacterium]
MRDDAKEQLDIVNARIRKAKSSLEQMEDSDLPKNLQMEAVDTIPIGLPPEEEEKTVP